MRFINYTGRKRCQFEIFKKKTLLFRGIKDKNKRLDIFFLIEQ